MSVTPRTGKPVEVNALWVNALQVLAELRERAGLSTSVEPTRETAAAFRRRYRVGELLRARRIVTLRI